MILGAIVGFLIGSGFGLAGSSPWPATLWRACAAALIAAVLARWWSGVWLKSLRDENAKVKSLIRDTERRNNLLQQGLSLLESNEWQLEQDVQRLANLLASRPDVNTSSQSEVPRAIQRIQQTLREGTAITRQTKAIQPFSPHQVQGKPSDQQKKQTIEEKHP